MRILVITDLFPPDVIGGYEIACANIVRGLKDRGHEVYVLTTWNHLPQLLEESAWVHRDLELYWHIPYKSNDPLIERYNLHYSVCSSFVNTSRVIDVLRAFAPDVVYVWNLMGIGGAAILDVLNQVKIPWALHLMDKVPADILEYIPADVLGLFNAQGADLYRRAGILSISQHLLDEIEKISGIDLSQNAEIVPGSVELTNIEPHQPYLQAGSARFVTAGIIAPHKGIDLILQASSALKKEGLNFSVDIYGDGELAYYVDFAKSLQIDDRVCFKGPRKQKELLRLYAGYDAFLFPTWEREPFGFAPIEAAWCGTVPIMTRNCGASERLVDQVHCLKIERTVDDLAATMRKVITNQVDLAKIGTAGSRLVTQDLSFDRIMDQVEKTLTHHMLPWKRDSLDDPNLKLLAFIKHNLSVALRFS